MHRFIIQLFWLVASNIFRQDINTTKLQLDYIKTQFDLGKNNLTDNYDGQIKQLIQFYLTNYNHINDLK